MFVIPVKQCLYGITNQPGHSWQRQQPVLISYGLVNTLQWIAFPCRCGWFLVLGINLIKHYGTISVAIPARFFPTKSYILHITLWYFLNFSHEIRHGKPSFYMLQWGQNIEWRLILPFKVGLAYNKSVILHCSQYHGFWCHGVVRSHSIITHGIGKILQKYSISAPEGLNRVQSCPRFENLQWSRTSAYHPTSLIGYRKSMDV